MWDFHLCGEGEGKDGRFDKGVYDVRGISHTSQGGHRNRSWEMSCDAAAAHAQGRWKAQILYEMCMHDESVVVN